MSRPIKKRPVEIPKPALYFNCSNRTFVGSVMTDDIGANNGTVVGSPTSVSGRASEALSFLSTGPDYIQVPTDASFDVGTGDYTIAELVKISAGNQFDSSKREAASLTNPGFAIIILASSVVGYHCDGSANRIAYTFPATMDDGKWHLVVVSATRSGTLTVYLDGVKMVDSDISAQQVSINSAEDLYIGAQ